MTLKIPRKPSPPPWSMQWRVVYACNRSCWFCGIHAIPKSQRSVKLTAPLPHSLIMPVAMAEEMSRQIHTWMPHPRIEFGVGGESTIHPEFFEIVSTLRQNAPKSQLMVQTNIEPWIENAVPWLKEFYGRGGNILTLNCYLPGIRERVVDALNHPEVKALGIEVSDDYYGKERQLKHISPYYYKSPRTRQAYVSTDLGTQVRAGVTQKMRSRAMTNHAGSVPDRVMQGIGITPLQKPMERGCMWPSKQLVIAETGKALMCCYDQWLDKVSPGKFPEQTLAEIWDSETFWLMRGLLKQKNRQMLPCATCDYHGGFGRAKHPLQLANPRIGSQKEMLARMNEITAEQIKTWDTFQLQRMIEWRDRLPEHLQALIPEKLPNVSFEGLG